MKKKDVVYKAIVIAGVGVALYGSYKRLMKISSRGYKNKKMQNTEG